MKEHARTAVLFPGGREIERNGSTAGGRDECGQKNSNEVKAMGTGCEKVRRGLRGRLLFGEKKMVPRVSYVNSKALGSTKLIGTQVKEAVRM